MDARHANDQRGADEASPATQAAGPAASDRARVRAGNPFPAVDIATEIYAESFLAKYVTTIRRLEGKALLTVRAGHLDVYSTIKEK